MKHLQLTFSHWQNGLGLLLAVIFLLAGFLAPWISPEDPRNPGPFMQVKGSQAGDQTPHPPSANSILGTLPGQFDIFHALIAGIPNALSFGIQITLISSIFGILYGATAAYAGGKINGLMMRIADSFLAFPVIAGVVMLQQLWVTVMSNSGGIYFRNAWVLPPDAPITPIQILFQWIDPLILVLIIFSWMPYARLMNIGVTALKNADFIQAAHALGASPARIILRHLIPNAIPTSIVQATRDMGTLTILQATFTFIGLTGGSVWGEMLSMGRNWVIGPGNGVMTYWWTFVPATLALILFGMTWNLLGDAINEFLDPHSY